LEMRHALTVALQDFAGALVVVSHDRHLMRSVTDRLLLVSDGGADDFAGDLADYGAWLRERNREEATADAGGDGKSDSDAKQRRKQSAARRQELKPLRQEIRQLEKTIDKLSQRKQTLDEQLGDPGLYDEGQKARLQELLREQGQVEKDLAEAEEAWLEASERLEAAMAET
ncbi:MAG TPA: ABC transporter ATP-binding protein, partial [Gammaproteobacteria bacterium]|nr:ABC transporter ATP-binding protein [Gammaproteobacteria bacterium]